AGVRHAEVVERLQTCHPGVAPVDEVALVADLPLTAQPEALGIRVPLDLLGRQRDSLGAGQPGGVLRAPRPRAGLRRVVPCDPPGVVAPHASVRLPRARLPPSERTRPPPR